MTNTATAITFPSYFPGDLVQAIPALTKYRGVTFIVDEVPGFGSRRTKTKVRTAEGSSLSGQPEWFIVVGDPSWVGPVPDKSIFEAPAAVSSGLRVGALVRLARREGLFVLTGETSGKFRASELGGAPDGRYVRGITAASVTEVIDPARVTVS